MAYIHLLISDFYGCAVQRFPLYSMYRIEIRKRTIVCRARSRIHTKFSENFDTQQIWRGKQLSCVRGKPLWINIASRRFLRYAWILLHQYFFIFWLAVCEFFVALLTVWRCVLHLHLRDRVCMCVCVCISFDTNDMLLNAVVRTQRVSANKARQEATNLLRTNRNDASSSNPVVNLRFQRALVDAGETLTFASTFYDEWMDAEYGYLVWFDRENAQAKVFNIKWLLFGASAPSTVIATTQHQPLPKIISYA